MNALPNDSIDSNSPRFRSPGSVYRVKQAVTLMLIALGLSMVPFHSVLARLHDDDPIPGAPMARVSTDNVVLTIMEQRNIPCRVPGIVLSSEIEEGTLLKPGSPVMAIDDRKSVLDVNRLTQELNKTMKEASSRVELEYQKKSIEVAQAELNRALISNQRQQGSVAQSEIDQLNLQVQKAVAEKDKIEFQIELKNMTTKIRQAELAIGKQKVADHKIDSPIAGMVEEVMKRPGEWVEMSEPVCRIVRLDKLRAEVLIPADIAMNGLAGSQGFFTPKLKSLKGQTYPAKVTFVAPKAVPLSAKVKVWIEIDNSELKLVPGLTGSLTIK